MSTIGDEPLPATTLTGFESAREQRGAARGRRVILALMLLGLLAGLVGFLGVHASSASTSTNGYRLTVQYARVARAGLDVPFQVEVVHPGGFPTQITLAITASYFSMFESQGFWPQPSSTLRDGDLVYLTFDPPKGDTFVFDYDAYIQPSSQIGRSATVTVMGGALQPLASVHVDTTLLP